MSSKYPVIFHFYSISWSGNLSCINSLTWGKYFPALIDYNTLCTAEYRKQIWHTFLTYFSVIIVNNVSLYKSCVAIRFSNNEHFIL